MDLVGMFVPMGVPFLALPISTIGVGTGNVELFDVVCKSATVTTAGKTFLARFGKSFHVWYVWYV